MDLHPPVIRVEHVRAGDGYMGAGLRRSDVRAGACPVVVGAAGAAGRLPGHAAGFVRGHDLDDDRAALLVCVAVVDESRVRRVECDEDVIIAVRFASHASDVSGHRDAGLKHREPVRMVDVLERVATSARRRR
jgi:hypothetical protein